MPAKKNIDDDLIKLVQDEIAKDPYPLDGYMWAIIEDGGQDGLADHFGVATKTLARRLALPPFKTRVIRPHRKRLTLIRFREPGEPDVTPDELMRAKANADKKAMIEAWKAKIKKKLTIDEEQLLWGFALDLAAFPDVDPVEVFKDSIKNWHHTASAIKMAMLAAPKGKVMFLDFPSIGHIRVFWKAVLHAHVTRMMEGKKVPEDKVKIFAAVLNATEFDPMADDAPVYTEEHVTELMTKKAAKIAAAKEAKAGNLAA